jgi:hypothetical protein
VLPFLSKLAAKGVRERAVDEDRDGHEEAQNAQKRSEQFMAG